MDGYSTDSNERRLVPLLLATLAIGFAWMFAKLLAISHLSFPWWLDAPSSLGFYAALYALFDKYLWLNRVVRKLGLSRIPNVAGSCHGFLTSSFDDHLKRHDVLSQVCHSLPQIFIFLKHTTAT